MMAELLTTPEQRDELARIKNERFHDYPVGRPRAIADLLTDCAALAAENASLKRRLSNAKALADDCYEVAVVLSDNFDAQILNPGSLDWAIGQVRENRRQRKLAAQPQPQPEVENV
jgi:hypothetical protein